MLSAAGGGVETSLGEAPVYSTRWLEPEPQAALSSTTRLRPTARSAFITELMWER